MLYKTLIAPLSLVLTSRNVGKAESVSAACMCIGEEGGG
jgi:hypothetical protein